ncbi:MAG TPA: sigma-70 family RNA polymerase sigma factor [Candidatus Acidoferrales bacterium]|nr:sigma-70 family RNA polymerase sigma factor [Candidatus Acidoferrales bacterium]
MSSTAVRIAQMLRPQRSAVEVQTSTSAKAKESDEQLIALIAKGEQDALDCLFLRYKRIVHGVGVRILRDTAEAEDLVQDVFLFIRAKCSIFDPSRSSAGSWIVQMAYQRAFDKRRRLMAHGHYSQTGAVADTDHMTGSWRTEADYSPDVVFGRNGLSRFVKNLSVDQRETLRLFFFEGYTLTEISQKLGQSLGNIRNHYYRGLDKLRKQMFGSSSYEG